MRIKTDHNKLLEEVRTNKRVQWLGLIILGLLSISGLKALSEENSSLVTEIQNQHRLLQKLDAATKLKLDVEDVELTVQKADVLLSRLPMAPSIAVAEAESLSRIARITSNVKKSRSSLVATNTINTAQNTLWQVRVELQGQLDEQFFSSFLQKIDGSDPTVRLISMRYRPDRAGVLYIVVDFMFREGER